VAGLAWAASAAVREQRASGLDALDVLDVLDHAVAGVRAGFEESQGMSLQASTRRATSPDANWG